MGSWFYLWENGDVSFVSASSKEAAVLLLDEVGGAYLGRLKPIQDGFFVTFSPTKIAPQNEKTEWGWESKTEESEDVIGILGDTEVEARRRVNIPDNVMAPIHLLGRLSTAVYARGTLKEFNLKAEIAAQVWKDESTEYVQPAVDLVEAYLEKRGSILTDLVRTGKQLSELLNDIIKTQRSIIFKEVKSQV